MPRVTEKKRIDEKRETEKKNLMGVHGRLELPLGFKPDHMSRFNPNREQSLESPYRSNNESSAYFSSYSIGFSPKKSLYRQALINTMHKNAALENTINIFMLTKKVSEIFFNHLRYLSIVPFERINESTSYLEAGECFPFLQNNFEKDIQQKKQLIDVLNKFKKLSLKIGLKRYRLTDARFPSVEIGKIYDIIDALISALQQRDLYNISPTLSVIDMILHQYESGYKVETNGCLFEFLPMSSEEKEALEQLKFFLAEKPEKSITFEEESEENIPFEEESKEKQIPSIKTKLKTYLDDQLLAKNGMFAEKASLSILPSLTEVNKHVAAFSGEVLAEDKRAVSKLF